jgi:Gram-negative bacterial TonB protein C-terminal
MRADYLLTTIILFLSTNTSNLWAQDPDSIKIQIKSQDPQKLVVVNAWPLGQIKSVNIDSLVAVAILDKIKMIDQTDAINKYGDKGKWGAIEILTKTDKIFERLEVEALFPGGDKAWKNFLMENLNGQIPSDNGAPDGKYVITIQFIVHRDGTITEIRRLTAHGFGMEEECIRVMKLSPPWVPGMQNGRIVTSYKKQNFTFVIESE